MAPGRLIIALSALIAASPLSAQPDSGAMETLNAAPTTTAAPPGSANTKYCMRVHMTGHVIEPVRCWTRAEWADQGVDVDRDWADEGVRIIDA